MCHTFTSQDIFDKACSWRHNRLKRTSYINQEIKAYMIGQVHSPKTRRTGLILLPPPRFCPRFLYRQQAILLVSLLHLIPQNLVDVNYEPVVVKGTQMSKTQDLPVFSRQQSCGGDFTTTLSLCSLKHIFTSVFSIKFPSNLVT